MPAAAGEAGAATGGFTAFSEQAAGELVEDASTRGTSRLQSFGSIQAVSASPLAPRIQCWGTRKTQPHWTRPRCSVGDAAGP